MGGGSGSMVGNGSGMGAAESSQRRKRNCFELQRWPTCHLSSQLKQSPFARRACISAGLRQRIGNGEEGGGFNSKGGSGTGVARRVLMKDWSRNLASINLAKPRVWGKE